MVASHKPANPRLAQTIADIENALGAELDWEKVQIKTHDDSLQKYKNIQKIWHESGQNRYAEVLKNWLAAQISASIFPFAGLGKNLQERITVIGLRFALFRLAIMCLYANQETALCQDDVVRVAQGLSRFLEHLESADFILQICADAGWSGESGLCGLLV